MKRFDEILAERYKIVKKVEFYMNDKGEKVPKEEATKVIIAEYDKEGKLVNEVFGTLEKTTQEKKQNKKEINEEER